MRNSGFRVDLSSTDLGICASKTPIPVPVEANSYDGNAWGGYKSWWSGKIVDSDVMVWFQWNRDGKYAECCLMSGDMNLLWRADRILIASGGSECKTDRCGLDLLYGVDEHFFSQPLKTILPPDATVVPETYWMTVAAPSPSVSSYAVKVRYHRYTARLWGGQAIDPATGQEKWFLAVEFPNMRSPRSAEKAASSELSTILRRRIEERGGCLLEEH